MLCGAQNVNVSPMSFSVSVHSRAAFACGRKVNIVDNGRKEGRRMKEVGRRKGRRHSRDQPYVARRTRPR